MSILLMLLFVAAISLDGIAVGVAYGIRRLRIPPISMTIIGVTSGAAASVSIAIGKVLSGCLSPFAAHAVGGLLLVAVGGFLIWQNYREPLEPETKKEPTALVCHFTLRLGSFRMVFRILREPEAADADSSGYINPVESIFLGVALAVDAFGAGIAAGMTNLPIIATGITTALLSIIFLLLGLKTGSMFCVGEDKMKAVPGAILVGLGLLKILH